MHFFLTRKQPNNLFSVIITTNVENKEHLQKIQSDWRFKVGAIVYDYETYSRLTGHVLSDHQRKEVLRIWNTNYSDDHKESLIEKKLNDNPFK